MNYNPKFIPDKSIADLQQEIKEMYDDQYKYGYSVDKCRMWDINYTISVLQDK